MISQIKLLLLSVFLSHSILSYGEETPLCNPFRIAVDHIEGKGIGYAHGYTSFDFSYSQSRANSLPFLDLRTHVFDDGRFASNAGVGYRHLGNQYIVGGNVYYDYRNTSRISYNQIGAGFELLTEKWDFRINGYLPVGANKTSWYNNRKKQKFAMRGLDAEVGVYSRKIKSCEFYCGAGPYFYQGKSVHAYGGEIRVSGRFKQYISLEFTGSYDNVFRDIFQARVSFSIPFGAKEPRCNTIGQRFVQPVIRDEIIVEKAHRL